MRAGGRATRVSDGAIVATVWKDTEHHKTGRKGAPLPPQEFVEEVVVWPA